MYIKNLKRIAKRMEIVKKEGKIRLNIVLVQNNYIIRFTLILFLGIFLNDNTVYNSGCGVTESGVIEITTPGNFRMPVHNQLRYDQVRTDIQEFLPRSMNQYDQLTDRVNTLRTFNNFFENELRTANNLRADLTENHSRCEPRFCMHTDYRSLLKGLNRLIHLYNKMFRGS